MVAHAMHGIGTISDRGSFLGGLYKTCASLNDINVNFWTAGTENMHID